MDASDKKYQIRMITGNHIAGLLSCKEKYINGDIFFYYEITSKQSLASIYDNRKIGIDFLQRFFIRLKTTWDTMSRFLLEEKYLLLNPEYIFVDVESNDFYFLYYPFEPEENYIQSLFEFFTDKVDCEDDKAVDVSFKALELIEREQFVLDEIITWFEEDITWEENGLPTDEITDEVEEKDFDKDKQERYVSRQIIPETKLTGRLLALLLGVAAICIYIYQSYDMSERIFIFFCGLLLADLLLILLCSAFFVYKKVSLYWEKKTDLNKEVVQFQEEPMEIDLAQHNYSPAGETYGKTIFIPWTDYDEPMLYGIGKGNKYHIDLAHLPVTVGKLTDVVDIIIDEQSISRRHVKFFGENGNIIMVDLNSTNGTFKNDVRLEPNESKILEKGDEIRLGRLKFIYR